MTNQPETKTEYQNALEAYRRFLAAILFETGSENKHSNAIIKALQFQIDHREEIEAGWVIVPKIPTDEIIKYIADRTPDTRSDLIKNLIREDYILMIAASQNAGEGEL